MSNVGAIAGGVTVGVFVLVFIAVTTAVLVVLRAKSRGRPTKVETEGTTNPVYDASSKWCTPVLITFDVVLQCQQQSPQVLVQRH